MGFPHSKNLSGRMTRFVASFVLWLIAIPGVAWAQTASDRPAALESFPQFVETYCIDCHTTDDPASGLDLESFDFSIDQFKQPDFDSGQWELLWKRLASRQMPPADAIRPVESEYTGAINELVEILDQRARAFPRPGRTEVFRRLTRLEYKNAIRDLLAIEMNEKEWLPKDPSSHGFDNITVTELSPLLMNRYLSAAQKISRLAVGSSTDTPTGVTVRLPADLTQESHIAGLPLGTRGGAVFEHHFPQTGEYEFELRLMRDRDEKVEGLNRRHEIDILIDRQRRHQFTVQPPPDRKDYTHSDSHLKIRIPVTAGTHEVGVTFPRQGSSLLEIKRQPFDASYNRHRHPRTAPAIFQIQVFGPFDPSGVAQTAPRQLIFGTDLPVTHPDNPIKNSAGFVDGDLQKAKRILARLARRAYRRPVSDEDLQTSLRFFEQGRKESGFEAGVELALTSILINPNFLFRIEAESPTDAKDGCFAISDFELASRLSFFLWSSIPDDQLLSLAEQKQLQRPDVLARQVRRMLRSDKSASLINNFAAQWLYLRNLDSMARDLRRFPDFDDNLRQAFRKETELLFEDVLRNDRSALRLIDSNYTFLNERLATHYGIPGVRGSRFRQVDVSGHEERGGILKHGSILSVTAYATRTSPTIRGAWVLENILGTPPPPPPPDVPNLASKSELEPTSVRERLALHRANPACARCHDLIDPIGFALENYDAVGRWRQYDDVVPIDSSATLPDGTQIQGVQGLEDAILKHPDMFLFALTSKLTTFALGRHMTPDDGPEIRRIIQRSAADDYRLSTLITQIVLSKPFRYRSLD
jgi:hypothetical protein